LPCVVGARMLSGVEKSAGLKTGHSKGSEEEAPG